MGVIADTLRALAAVALAELLTLGLHETKEDADVG